MTNNPKQYKGTGTPIVAKVKDRVEKLTEDVSSKVSRLELLTESQQVVISKLQRDVSRLKDLISDIITVLKDRG